MIERRLTGRVILVLTALAVSGCTAVGNFADQVDRLNRSIETARNEALLLNIVRASKNRPLAFSLVSVARGSGQLNLQLGLPTATFGPGQNAVDYQWVFGRSGTNMISGNTAAGFDLSVLDSQEFYRGLLAPLDATTFNFFLQQGFPRDVLFNLFIERVRLSDGHTVRELRNDPHSNTFLEFQQELRNSLDYGLTTEAVVGSIDVGPPISTGGGFDLHELAELARAGLQLRPLAPQQPHAYQVSAPQVGARFCLDPVLATRPVPDDSAVCGARRDQRPQTAGAEGSAVTYAQPGQGGLGPQLVISIYPRSTEGIFRYLGALIDTLAERQVMVQPPPGAPATEQQMFIVERTPSLGNDFVSVTYEGESYRIPLEHSGITTRVLGALGQLVALSTSVAALPVSRSISISS